MAFQQAGLFEWRTVRRNVELPARAAQVGPPAAAAPGPTRCWSWWSWPTSPTTTRASCRAACSSGWPSPARWPSIPPLLLMDEPFGALDEMTREHMQAELLRICGDTGTTVVFVTHSIPEAVYLSDRVVVMSPRPGRIAAVIDVDLGPRTDDTREAPEFFKKVTEVREALRGIEGAGEHGGESTTCERRAAASVGSSPRCCSGCVPPRCGRCSCASSTSSRSCSPKPSAIWDRARSTTSTHIREAARITGTNALFGLVVGTVLGVAGGGAVPAASGCSPRCSPRWRRP